MTLTAKKVEFAKPVAKAYKLSDGNGLYLYVTVKGAKLWRYDYRYDNKRKTLSYGIFPDITLSQARKLHDEAKEMIKKGIDPLYDKKQQRLVDKSQFITFEYVTKQWLEHWKHDKAEKYVFTTFNGLKKEVFPAFGKKPIHELTPSDIKKHIRTIVSRGAFDIAKRTLQKINQICRYAYVHEYLKVPLLELKPSDLIPARRQQNFHRIKSTEITQLLNDIREYQGSPITICAIKLMLYTFLRTGELIKGEWSEIDFEAKQWTIPATRMKMKRPHIVPLSTKALLVLEELAKYSSGTKWLFPSTHGRKGEKSICNNTILFALYRMGYKGRMTGHGFRGLASTVLHELDYDHQHIEVQLAHSCQNAISAAYNHAQYLPQRTKMMQDWADYLTSKGDI